MTQDLEAWTYQDKPGTDSLCYKAETNTPL